MNKAWFWFTWVLTFIVVNLAAVPIAMFALFGTQEGTSIFSADYAVAAGIFLLSNFITLQMLIAGRKDYKKGFLVGLNVAVLQVAGLVVFISTISTAAIIFTMVIIVIAAVLLIQELRRRRY
ncbi:hypothetical protein F9802_16125 [Bacillus aerolatus]|uniref:Uncharacterized protein n=1 Tax=Bacillus aerolatus TaxID=2653354 RepID=A0A6I1FRQ8_9BACI|nr:hypothetical protein [Bacillus aerolatus]KAB7704706.1 hypothetical protein F9802_16125 [Bacillus aerolatus]